MRLGLATLFAAAVLVLPISASASSPSRSQASFGVVSQAPLQERDLVRMSRGGVRTLRILVHWGRVEAQPLTFDWSQLDPVVGWATQHRIRLLPFVLGTPAWVARSEVHPPIDNQAARSAWKRFLRELVARYGANGEFWRARGREAPIRHWQIWNEPNFHRYWHPRPSPTDYVRLLKMSARVIRRTDPRAEIVMAGVAPISGGYNWWRFLNQVYEVAGARRYFDEVALHPYSPSIGDLTSQLALVRRIMRSHGDGRTPLAVTEIGWSSGRGPAPLNVGRARQADLLARAFGLLAKRKWRVSETHWYAWQDAPLVEPGCSFCELAGLVDRAGRPKPSWSAFRRVVGRQPRPDSRN